jgi:hypothetical protein
MTQLPVEGPIFLDCQMTSRNLERTNGIPIQCHVSVGSVYSNQMDVEFKTLRSGAVLHACNPRYLGGSGRKILVQRCPKKSETLSEK